MDKLTHTGIYGTSETISTIEDFLDVEINYFARTNFSGMTNIVDALGGVTFSIHKYILRIRLKQLTVSLK